ncbi:MAG: hypothetical protein ACI4WS_01465 [Oscillospiraceae bacterium]
MGFFDVLEGIGEAFSDLGRDLRDLHEYATVGFVEEVIKGNDNYKTSYEREDEANSIYAREQSRQRAAEKSLNNAIDSLNNRIKQLNQRKRRILDGLSSFTEAPGICAKAASAGGCPELEETYFSEKLMRVTGMDNTLLGMKIRSAHADEYLADAEAYRSESRARVAELNSCAARVTALNDILDTEELTLDILEQSMQTRRGLRYRDIAAQLHQLLAHTLSGTDSDSGRQYAAAVNRLSELVRGI